MKTKTIPLAIALVASLGAASVSSAAGYNFFQPVSDTLDGTTVFDLGLVRTEGAGVVEIYNFQDGQIGDLVGSHAVNAGANPSVPVQLDTIHDSTVIAVLKVQGAEVAQKVFSID